MLSWEKGGVAPIYLCESHVAQVGRPAKKNEDIVAATLQSLRSNSPAEQPKSPAPASIVAEAEVGLEKEYLTVVPVPVPDLTSDNSTKVSANESNGDMAREDFEAYGTVLQKVGPSTSTAQSEGLVLERLCASRYGERCTCDAAVHCPRCGRWFCDAHAEDEKWHQCALPS